MYSTCRMMNRVLMGQLRNQTKRKGMKNSSSRSGVRIRPPGSILCPHTHPVHYRRHPRFSTSNSSPPSSYTPPEGDTSLSWLPVTLFRLASALSLVHVVSEYGMTITLCEGPSMQPTIQPRGEIILLDLLTPRLFRSTWKGETRSRQARKLQDQHEQQRTEAMPSSPHTSWYEPYIPVNELSSRGKWKRFMSQITSGISVGDVLVVQHPQRAGTVCKRVLGMPGDTVVVSNDNLRGAAPTRTSQRNRYRGRSDFNSTNLLVIPDGHVWLEGDNAFNSSDSRQYGPLPAALIVGRVLCRVWPLGGNMRMERGGRPAPASMEMPPGVVFPGSTVLPAGYEGEEIVRKVS